MADKSNDPAAIWQNMIGEMEKGFNSFANQAMASPEFSKVMNQVGGVTAGAQKQLGELMEKYLVSMNLPSRAQMVSMAERLQSIEGQLNEIKALLHQVHHNSGAPEGGYPARRGRRAPSVRRRRRRAKMNAPAGPRSGSIPERIQSEVQRAIQRSIKGVEYIASSGPSLGSTPKDILHVRGTMNLYHYRPMADEIYRVPILIVMATTNRGYILDMVPGQSFIEFLLKRGYDVYMLDWTAPKPEEKSLRMEDYVLDFIPDCVRRVQQDSGETDVTVIGYCFGGVLSLLYGSIFNDGPMKNLICFTTPIDFREMKLFQNFSDRRYFDVDRLVDSVGNVPPEMILSSFEMLRPASRAASQVQLWENIWNDEFVKSYRMFDRWATDTLPLAGEYFRTITKDLMWDNKLFNDTMSVGGRAADISKIKVPILHAVAEHDHIVPYDAAKHLIPKVGSTDKEEVMLKGGHVSLVAGANAIKRLWPKLDSWLGERST
jgi:polyhydroxyalkanoate synthase